MEHSSENTPDSGPEISMPGWKSQADAMYLTLSAVRRSATAEGLIGEDGITARHIETYAGGRHAVTHHLTALCPKLRTGRPERIIWRGAGRLASGSISTRPTVAAFARAGGKRLCKVCTAAHRPAARSFAIAVLDEAASMLVEMAYDLERAKGGLPEFLPVEEKHLKAVHLAEGADRIAGDTDETTVTSARKAVAEGIRAAEEALGLMRQMALSQVPQLPAEELRRLAASAVADPVSGFRVNPNPVGRSFKAISGQSNYAGPDTLVAPQVAQVFRTWHAEQVRSETPVRWGRSEAVRSVAALQNELYAGGVAARLTEWHITPDMTLSPYELVMANWREAAVSELTVLFGDWADRYQHVADGPDGVCTVLVHRSGQKDAGQQDRYGMLQLLTDRYPLVQLGSMPVWKATVPVKVARALERYDTLTVRIASLEGYAADPEQVAETALALGRVGDGWFQSAVTDAAGILA